MKAPSVWQSTVALGLLAAVLPGAAMAYCAEPSIYRTPPSPPSYGRPSAPYCLSGFAFSGKHTCDEYEIDSYVSDVNRYIDELNDFVAEAAEFASSARLFAEEALTFARCEAEDIQIQRK